jgi:hypothetical protein
VRRRPVTAGDVAWLGPSLGTWHPTRRWSLRGRSPSPTLVRQLLGERVWTQQSIWAADGTPCGLVQITKADLPAGVAELGLLIDPERASEVRAEVAAFVAEAMAAEPRLRKLCVWSFADELDVAATLGHAAVEVGRLTDHERRAAASYVDLVVHEIWREAVA